MALAIAAMAGCQTTSSSNTDSPNSASGSDGEQIKAVMVSVMNGGDYWGPIEEGFLETCESYGWTGEYWSPVTTNSGTEMVELIETAITQGYDVISTCVTDANIFSDVLTRAREAGITVIGTTAPAEGLLDAFVGFDQYQLGYNHGQFIASLAKNDGVTELNVVTVQTVMATDQNAQRQGFMDGLAAAFNGPINDLAQETNDSNAATTQDKLNAIFVAHPELNVCGCLESYASVGAAVFIEENGLKGKFYAVGALLGDDMIEWMENGILVGTSYMDVKQFGVEVVKAAKAIREGQEFEAQGATSYLTLNEIKEKGLID